MGRRSATIILRLSCALAPTRESDVRLQSERKFSSYAVSHTHRYVPFLSVGSSWPFRAGTSHTLCVHSPRALAFPSRRFGVVPLVTRPSQSLEYMRAIGRVIRSSQGFEHRERLTSDQTKSEFLSTESDWTSDQVQLDLRVQSAD